VTGPVLDHVAVGTRALTDGWDLFGGLLGGSWVYGGDSPGYWWGQLAFSSGPKIELLTPTGGPDSAFLDRFLSGRGPGPHHFNFIVPDIQETLSRVMAAGIEPVQVSLQNPRWREAFLHPRDAYGIVIQVAEQSGPPPALEPPAELPSPGPACAFALVEHYVSDLAGATALFQQALQGEAVTAAAGTAELSWPNGARLRLLQAPAGPDRRPDGRAGQLHFSRAGRSFAAAERSRAADVAGRLGVALRLTD
jgi:methylmalonyl-CoA/ethylmalonyl-CoA epimerase